MKSFLSIIAGAVLLQALGAQASRLQKAVPQSRVFPSHHSSSPVHALDICEGKEDGTMLPDSENCQYFYVCYDGEAALASCLRRYCFKAKDSNCVPCAGCEYPPATLKELDFEITVAIHE